MAKRLIVNRDEWVGPWVASRIKGFTFSSQYSAIGLAGPTGDLIAGCIYDEYREHHDINMHLAAMPGSRWMNREFLREGFRYPFLYLDCKRVTGLVRADNEAAQRLDEHLGFTLEGVLRRKCIDGADLLVYGMLREECRWLKVGAKSGCQPFRESAAAERGRDAAAASAAPGRGPLEYAGHGSGPDAGTRPANASAQRHGAA